MSKYFAPREGTKKRMGLMRDVSGQVSWKTTLVIGLVAAGVAVYLCCPQTVAEVSDYAARAQKTAQTSLKTVEAKLHEMTERLWSQREAAFSRVATSKDKALPQATTTPPPRRVLLWHDGEAVARRGKVDSGEATEFLASLRRSFDDDRRRLQALAAEHLNVEMEPVFSQQFLRLPGFLDEVFGYGNTASLIYASISATGGVVEPEARKSAAEKVQAEISKRLIDRYRETVLSPHAILGPARAAAGRAHAALRRDLLANCDRYDRAFQSFLRQHVSEVEILDTPTGWRLDPAWAPEKANFRSLCHTTRLADGGRYAINDKAFAELVEPGMIVYELVAELTKPLAEAAIDMAQSTALTMRALDSVGLPPSWSYWPAAAWNFTKSSLTFSWQLIDHLDPATNRPKLDANLREALRQARAEALIKIQGELSAFVASRLDGIESVVVARSDGDKASR
jgi:hypothetical protein